MATVTVYNHTFTVPDRYAEGYALKTNEATALNQLMAELISHKLRGGPLEALKRGETPNAEQIAAAEALIAEQSQSFEFGAGRGSGEGRVVRSPLEREALAIARVKVREKIKANGMSLAKKGEAARDGEYPFEAYEEKVAEIAQHPAVIAAAKKALKAREGGEDVDVAL